MKKNIQDLLISLLRQSLKELHLNFAGELILDFPTDSRFGDLSTNVALRLGRQAKKSSIEIAQQIINCLQRYISDNSLKGIVREVKVEGAGFINFYLEDKYFYAQLKQLLLKRQNALKGKPTRRKRVLIEFVSANPTGSLSIAHARQAAVGDSLANIFAFLGHKVKREYYLNDEGNQINILGESVRLRLQELSGKKIEFPENYYQGEYIYEIAKKIQNSSTEAGSRLAQDKGREKIKNVGDFAADYILQVIKKELEDFGVKFDYWYSQKKLAKTAKIKRAFSFLKKKGLLYEEGGALWFKSTAFGDDKDRVLVKSDGNYTYLAPDIAYHQDKYRRGFDWLINLWGPDHHGYVNRLKASVAAFGHPPESLAIIIVQLATIFREGKPIQMSTRRGQYISLREVLDEVGRDAARFFFLMRRTSSHLDFDLDVAKKQSNENPVYYVQYAYARIASILRANTLRFSRILDLSLLKEKEEMDLMRKIWQFPSVLETCQINLDPYMLTVYLQELAETFHKFYDRHRVLGQHDALTRCRLALIEATQLAIGTGLDLAGISRPEKM